MRTPTLRTLTSPEAVVLAALLTACGPGSGTTGPDAPDFSSHRRLPQHSTSTIPLDDSFVSPCDGETVHFTGTISEQITIVPSDLVGGLHFELTDLYSATGTGQTSGLSYRVHGTSQTSFDSPNFEALNATFSDRAYIDFTTNAAGRSFRLTVQLHLVDLPSGEEKVTRDVDTLECRD